MLSRKNTDLRRRSCPDGTHDGVGRYRWTKAVKQKLAVLVIADDPDQNSIATEGGDVGRGISCGTRTSLRFVMPDDKHRSLTRNARDRSVQELIRDQIADYQYAAADKSIGEMGSCHRTILKQKGRRQ